MVTTTSAAPPPRPRTGFGRAVTSVLGGEKLLANVPVVTYRFDREGLFTLALSNGQTWRQAESDDVRIRWTDAASAHAVTIYKGALGTFNLAADDRNEIFKVSRGR